MKERKKYIKMTVEEFDKHIDDAYKQGYTKGYLQGREAGESDGISLAIKAFSEMRGEE